MEKVSENSVLEMADILIVEDSNTQASQISHLLESHKYKVAIAKNGEEALRELSKYKPALIISDIMMPRMNGYELCKEIKSNKITENIPVILLTQLSDPQEIIEGLSCGADSFINKPYNEKYLLTNIEKFLSDKNGMDLTKVPFSAQIHFNGKKRLIQADQRNIVSLLLNIYEGAINQNEKLIQAQNELKISNERLVYANKELEAFSYSVSHDLRAPLRHVSGFAGLLMDEFKEDLPDQAQHYLNNINDSILKMGVLIDALLKFSRTGRIEMSKTKLEMQQVFDEAFSEINQDISDRNIEWKITDLPSVSGDRQLLQMVWKNLLSNAVKFTSNRSKATIEVGCKEGIAEYIFYIRDNGKGFDMSYSHKLFGVFQRLHSSEEFQGVGIGLANVRQIILRHQGQTWAESEPDKGATFYFTLPIN